MKDNLHSHKSCSDQRSDATKGVRKLFNEFLMDGGVEDLINVVKGVNHLFNTWVISIQILITGVKTSAGCQLKPIKPFKPIF